MREWHDDLGWGVLDSAETPGGCWAHFSVVDTPQIGRPYEDVEMHEYKALDAGEVVDLEWDAPGQDGFDYRAVVVRPLP